MPSSSSSRMRLYPQSALRQGIILAVDHLAWLTVGGALEDKSACPLFGSANGVRQPEVLEN